MSGQLSRRLTADDPLGEYLHQKLTPVSSKKRPAYEAAKEARRMVIAEVVEALRDHGRHGKGDFMRMADWIEREFGGQDGA